MFANIFGAKNNSVATASTSSTAPSTSFGANLAVGSKGLSAEITEVGQKFIKTNKKYRDEIDKYKKIADFNKRLSGSYIANVYAMIDVSNLLNDYASFFNVLKEEIMKTDGQIGSLQAADIQYLESLTKSKIEEFSNRFIENSDKVKVLYTKYGQQDEVNKIVEAQNSMKSIIDDANTTYKTLINSTHTLEGGKKKRSTKVVKAKKSVKK